MTRAREQGKTVRRYIIEQLERHSTHIAKTTAQKFAITRQAVNKHLQKLVSEGVITQQGNTKSRLYKLASLTRLKKTYQLTKKLEEDQIWRKDITPSLGQLPTNVRDIWHYGFTEIFNNAIDHSEGTTVRVSLEKTAATTKIVIDDNGIGIFKKIQIALGLTDERHAVLELAKGKLTTDPAHHSGEGIFFASRMFDDFQISSGEVHFSHWIDEEEDWILERRPKAYAKGTLVIMQLGNHTKTTTKKVFDQFTSGDDYGFTKTVVPVDLVQYGDENLISRSQAKRLLARIDKFRTVILDFRGVTSIGQAFADEIFRVFTKQHPNTKLLEVNANAAVKRMISRARAVES